MLRLEELEVYTLAERISDVVWEASIHWDSFAKFTIGTQFVKAADSIGANIAEGYGRFAFKKNVQFCYYARGSFMETRHFLQRAKQRNLFQPEQEHSLEQLLECLGPKLNAYIRSIKSELQERKRISPK